MNTKKSNSSLIILLIFAVFTIILNPLNPSISWGHKVNIFAYAEDDKINTESYFNDGSPCINSIIQVFDPEGNELLRGKTDKEGLYSFEIPKKTTLKIVLTASLGHKAEYSIQESEIQITGSPDKEDIKERIIEKNSDHEEEGVFDKSLDAVNPDQIRNIIEKAVENSVEKSVKPLVKALAKAEATKTSLTDIIGGVGYIFGIMGIIFYFKKKEKIT